MIPKCTKNKSQNTFDFCYVKQIFCFVSLGVDFGSEMQHLLTTFLDIDQNGQQAFHIGFYSMG